MPLRTVRFTPLVPVLAVVLAAGGGCGRAADDTAPAPDSLASHLETGAPELAALEASLMSGTWQWVGTNRPADRLAPPDPSHYTLAFGGDRTASVRADCNRGSGNYTLVEGQKIEFGPMTTTLIGCPEGSLGPEYLSQLAAAEGWHVAGDTLSLTLELEGGTMRFARAAPAPDTTSSPATTGGR